MNAMVQILTDFYIAPRIYYCDKNVWQTFNTPSTQNSTFELIDRRIICNRVGTMDVAICCQHVFGKFLEKSKFNANIMDYFTSSVFL